MLKASNIFIVLNVLLFVALAFAGSWYNDNQMLIAVLLVVVFGIPHGAVDHILFMETNKANPIRFYVFYLSLISVILGLWLAFPTLSLVFFLFLSAYHFGQSQFSRFSNLSKASTLIIYASWGMSILSGLAYYNYEELYQLLSSSQDLNILLEVFQPQILFVSLLMSSLCFIVAFTYNLNAFTQKRFLIELGLFMLIHVCFYFHSLLLGFSLYFATLHSIQVLKEEYGFLSKKIIHFNLRSFLLKLIPYTLLSVIGIVIVLGLSHLEIIPLSKTLVIFMAVSALTLPHSMVMENFYQSKFHKAS